MFAKGTDSVIFLAKGKNRRNGTIIRKKYEKIALILAKDRKSTSLRLLLAKFENFTDLPLLLLLMLMLALLISERDRFWSKTDLARWSVVTSLQICSGC